MLIFGGKAYGGPRPPPLAYAVYAFINVDNCERPLTIGPTCDNTTSPRKRTRTKRYNEESRQAGRHSPNTGISSKTTRNLSEWTGVQLLCVAGYDIIWCRYMSLTNQAQNKLAAAQTKMERSMFNNITCNDRKTNICVRERTKVIDTQ